MSCESESLTERRQRPSKSGLEAKTNLRGTTTLPLISSIISAGWDYHCGHVSTAPLITHCLKCLSKLLLEMAHSKYTR